MTAPQTDLDQATIDALQPPCSAKRDGDCPDPASLIVRAHHPATGQIVSLRLMCNDHGRGAEAHFRVCPACSLLVHVTLEPIDRRPE